MTAVDGHLDLYKLIRDHNNGKYPPLACGLTTIHLAVMNGNFDMFKYLVDNAEDKNPKAGREDDTSLHFLPDKSWATDFSAKSSFHCTLKCANT